MPADTPAVPTELALVEARASAAAFPERFRSSEHLVFCHFDANGLAAIFGRGLERLGLTNV